jgi:peptidoglycan hydrolase-like protein with peptidoglycan-binding domain
MTKKKAADLVKFAKSMVGAPYWFATYCQKPTSALLAAKAKQCPSHYPASMNAQRQRDITNGRIVCDCNGLIKGYLWGAADGPVKYGSNGIGDCNADGQFARAKIKGPISTIPERPGVAVRYAGHVGVYIGNGEVVEARGRNYGVVRTKLKGRGWLHWYEIIGIDYSGGAYVPSPDVIFGEADIMSGDKGANVKQLQVMLNAVMQSGLDEDGDYGKKTKAAVDSYQKYANLSVTGIADVVTIGQLISDYNGDSVDGTDTEGASPGTEITTRPIVNRNGTYNVRKGPGMQFDIAGLTRKGDSLKGMVADDGKIIRAEGGWYQVMFGGHPMWVSGKINEDGGS